MATAPGQVYRSPGSIHVEGDASSASYFLAAGALAGGPVRVEGVGRDSIQGDVRFVDALEQMGATIVARRRPGSRRRVATGALSAIDADFNHIPDAAMTIAVVALYADGTTHAAQHRQLAREGNRPPRRDGDRAAQARRHGGGGRGLPARDPARRGCTAGQRIDTYDDHRMAMCFSLAALDGAARRGNAMRINDPKCVAKTFPDYFETFASIAKDELF